MEILSSLGINPTTVLWHAINFLILLVVLQRFLYRPVLRMLDERAARIQESMTHAEAIREERERAEAESKLLRDEAWKDAQEIMGRAQREAEALLAEARKDTREETERLLARAQAEIAQERERAFQELRAHLADLAVLAAGQVIGRSLDDASHRELVRGFLSAEANANGQGAAGAGS